MERLLGCFISALPLRMRLTDGQTLHEVLEQAQRTVLCKDPFKSRDDRVERLIASL